MFIDDRGKNLIRMHLMVTNALVESKIEYNELNVLFKTFILTNKHTK